MASENPFIFYYAQVRIQPMSSFIFLHFYCIVLSHVSSKHDWKTVLTFIQVPIKWDIIKHGTYMRDTFECINSIGYALFAVIKAIFINRNGLEMIMNYIYKQIN